MHSASLVRTSSQLSFEIFEFDEKSPYPTIRPRPMDEAACAALALVAASSFDLIFVHLGIGAPV
jgi:hypothetical protein